MIKLKDILTEEKLTEAEKVMYVVALTDGSVMSGDKAVSEKKALQIMSRIARQSDGWVNPFMIGVKYWNGTHPKRKGKPHKYNKKKIMVKEGKLTNETWDSAQSFSSKEAKKIMDDSLRNYAKELRKVQYKVIKDWMSKAKAGVIDFFDIYRGLTHGDIRRAHPYETDFLHKVLTKDKIIDRFRKYFGGKKGFEKRTKNQRGMGR